MGIVIVLLSLLLIIESLMLLAAHGEITELKISNCEFHKILKANIDNQINSKEVQSHE